MTQIELSVVIPGYNEGEIIKENLRSIHDSVLGLDVSFEIIFINDGSTDNTAEIVNRSAQELSELHLISYEYNQGRGYALRQGFSIAKGKYIITIESDMNYGQNIILALYHAITSRNADIVVASPYMRGGSANNIQPVRFFLSKWGNKVLSASLGGKVHTVSGMTRIYKGGVIKNLPLFSNDKEIHLEILSKALAFGYKIIEIPAALTWPDRKLHKTSGRKSSFAAKKYIISHLTFTVFEKPLLLFGLIGVVLLLSGMLFGLYITYLWATESLSGNRPLITLVIVLILGGVQVLSIGLLGSQINDLRKEIYRIQNIIRIVDNVISSQKSDEKK